MSVLSQTNRFPNNCIGNAHGSSVCSSYIHTDTTKYATPLTRCFFVLLTFYRFFFYGYCFYRCKAWNNSQQYCVFSNTYLYCVSSLFLENCTPLLFICMWCWIILFASFYCNKRSRNGVWGC